MSRALPTLAALATVALGCGGSESLTIGEQPEASELCQVDPTGACSGNCAFDPPSIIDCASACAGIVTVCESGCGGGCEGVNLDPTLCAVTCEQTKGQRCTNLVFGCYDNKSACKSVGNCVVNGG